MFAPKDIDAYRCVYVGVQRQRCRRQSVPDYIRPFLEFDDAERMRQSSYYERVVGVMEELVKFTLQTRELTRYLSDRCRSRGKLLRFVTALVWITSFISNVFQYA